MYLSLIVHFVSTHNQAFSKAFQGTCSPKRSPTHKNIHKGLVLYVFSAIQYTCDLLHISAASKLGFSPWTSLTRRQETD